MKSPYSKDTSKWSAVTDRLLASYPLSPKQLVEIALSSWEDLFHSRLGRNGYEIGRHVVPEPQIMGFLLHELIPLNLEASYPGQWAKGRASTECDAVYLQDSSLSFEIKTSSSKRGIFGNRSYTHATDGSKKQRGSFYLAVNFEKFVDDMRPEVTLVRFGWLGDGDWIGQRAESGQQARLTPEAKSYKLRIIYERLVK